MAGQGSSLDWAQVEQLFHAALELPAEQRKAFLHTACAGNAPLFNEMKSLLAAEAGEIGVLDKPLPMDTVDAERQGTALSAGERIGSWRILSELGHGGMGIVFLAERADGAYEQQVALKIIRDGLFARAMESDFVRERKILGRLQHPNIARVIDAGATIDGLLFLVMELVAGEPINQWVQARQANIETRLKLLLQVCDALQYAHSNLVVHRDLKPGNILVTGEGNVRLLDFGVARLLVAAEDDVTTDNNFLNFTPEYAAPEQLSSDATSTSSDIFSLGAVMYELLTDQGPRQPVADTPAEILASLREHIGLPSMAKHLSAARQKQLRGDLDAIVRKATAADAGERYASVAELSEDIRRYLGNEPVLARSSHFFYRSDKFVRRHRIGVAAMLAISLAVAVGIGTTIWQAGVAAAQARKAEAVKEFVLSLFGGVDPAEALGDELTARQLVDEGAVRIQSELESEPVVRGEILTFLADMYDKLDQDDRAAELSRQSLQLLSDEKSVEYANALLINGRIMVGRSEDDSAVASLQKALAIFSRRDLKLPAAESLDLLAIVRSRQGDVAESLRLTTEALELRIAVSGEDNAAVAESYNNLGVLSRTTGDYATARVHYERALTIRRRILSANHPQLAISINNLGALEYAEGDYARAAGFFSESLEINRRVNGALHHDTIAALNNLGFMQMRLGEIAAAHDNLAAVYDYWVQQDKAEHPNALVTRTNLATVLRTAGKLEDALAEYREVEPLIVVALGAEHPIVASVLHNQARTFLELGRIDEAEPLIARALATRRKALGDDHPDNAELFRDQALIAYLHDDLPIAAELAKRALALQLSKLPPAHPSISATRLVLGQIERANGNLSGAIVLHRAAVANYAKLFPRGHAELAAAETELGQSLLAAGVAEEAEALFAAARPVVADRLGEDAWQTAELDLHLAEAREQLGQNADALKASATKRLRVGLPADHPLQRRVSVDDLL